MQLLYSIIWVLNDASETEKPMNIPVDKNTHKLLQLLTNPWALVIGLLASFGLISLLDNLPGDQQATDADKLFPQTFMTGIETREFTTRGQLQHLLRTPRITHYQVNPDAPSDKDYTLIDHPQVDFYNDGEPSPWVLSANLGHSNANNTLLRLTDNVVIQQETPERGLVQISTSELLVYPQQQFAETDKAVKMRSPKGQMDALGMAAYMQEDRVHLKSQVRAVYEPR